MRDILVSLIVFGSLPFILKRPGFGVLMWVWISVMNLHTYGWDAATFPFAAVIATATILSLLVTTEPKSLPWTPVTAMLILVMLWMTVTTVFAFFPDASFIEWNKVMKMMLM